MTTEQLQQKLNELDKGLLLSGAHKPDSKEFCALEFSSQVRGKPFSDVPGDLPDLRPINDGSWQSDKARTEAMLPLLSALWDWSEWSQARKQKWSEIIAIETVRQIVSRLPNLPDTIRDQCQEVTNLAAARAAARAAAYAADVAAQSILQLVCQIWIEAATKTEGL